MPEIRDLTMFLRPGAYLIELLATGRGVCPHTPDRDKANPPLLRTKAVPSRKQLITASNLCEINNVNCE